MKTWLITLAKITLMGVLASGMASAYYHFVHFTSSSTPYRPVVEKFDLNALVDKTIRYYIDEDGPEEIAEGDSFDSIISQIRLAGKVWDSVATSELRVGFGGLGSGETPQISPGIDVIFDEIPPGLIAVGGPTSRSELVRNSDGSFIPINRSVVILNKDLSSQVSSSEGFFLTLVHEMGHALGLQHTLTSSVMATSITRATTKAAPLDVDDVAAISLLYPTEEFLETMGTIAGRLTMDGDGLNLASVVALSPNGASVSTLTNPDGTYRIEGVPPGQYYVYVHPLPPPVFGEVSPANIVLPRDPEGEPIAVGSLFETRFYPAARTAEEAVPLSVAAGRTIRNIDFAVGRRQNLDLYAVTTYSFPGNVAVKPGHLSLSTDRPFLVASGVGLAVDGAPVTGISASVIGGSAVVPSDGLIPYEPDPRFVQINLSLRSFSGSGARHLLFSVNRDVYVLPAGLHLTQGQPPLIDAIAAGFDQTGAPAVAIAGRNMGADTTILFDGEPAPVSSTNGSGILFVKAPPAASNHEATVVALNLDGQSSLFLHGNDSPRWSYPTSGAPAFSVTPRTLAAGTEAMIDIRGVDTSFVQGLTEMGIGSSDVVVRDLWVLDRTHLIANVSVAANAPSVVVPITVVSGLETVTQSRSFQVEPRASTAPVVHSPAFQPESNEPGVSPGGVGAIIVSGLSDAAGASMTLNDQAVSILSIEDFVITFAVPADLQPGPAVLRLSAALGDAAPIVIRIQAAPPVIASVFATDGTQINGGRAANPGELLTLVVLGMGDDEELILPGSLDVDVGGIRHSVHQIIPIPGFPGARSVQFFLGTNLPESSQVAVSLSIDGRSSTTIFIAVAER